MCKGDIRYITTTEKDEKNSMRAATVDEALEITGFGRYNFGLLLLCSWTLQAMGMDLFGTSFVVAAAVCDLNLSMQQRALLTAMPLCGVVVGAQVWGYVSDTRGRRLTLVLSMSLGFVFAALSSLAPDWRLMAALKLVAATFSSASNSGVYTLLGECCSAHARGRAMLLCTCALMCSQAAVAALAYPILPLQIAYYIPFLDINFRSWRLLALVMALPCAATAILLMIVHESPKFLVSKGRRVEALNVLRSIYARNSGNHPDSFPVNKLIDDREDPSSVVASTFMQAMWQQTAPLFQTPMLRNTLKLFYLVTVIYMTGSGFIMWLPYIMNNLFSVLEAGGGDGVNLCTIIGYSDRDFVSGNLTDFEAVCDDTVQDTTLFSSMIYGALASFSNLVLSLTCGSHKKSAMMAILTTSAAAGVAINLVTAPIAGGIFFFFFLMCALSMGILSVYFVELYPTSLRGTASCLSVMLGRSSAFLGVNAIGALLSTDCEATFYGWSLFLLSALVVAWRLPSDKSPVSTISTVEKNPE